MKRLVLIPNGWPCRLDECPPGLFVKGETVALKTEYGRIGEGAGPLPRWTDAYVGASGEQFWGGAHTNEDRECLMVQPVVAEWREEGE